jgi:aminomethyltransferase
VIVDRAALKVVAMPTPTPFHEATAAAGARYKNIGGSSIPEEFGDWLNEYRSACEACAVFDISHNGKVQLDGREADKFLHNLCTNDILNLPDGAGCEAFLTTNQAKTIGYVTVYKHVPPTGGSTLWLDPGPNMGERVAQHLDRYLISEQVTIGDRTDQFGQVHIAGPRARDALQAVLEAPLPDLRELGHTKLDNHGTDVFIRKRRLLGASGYDVLVPPEQSDTLWRALIRAGARSAGSKAYQSLRVEAGTPEFGVDIDETNLPQEVGRVDHAVSFTKGCYIGQETIARIRTYGHVNRSLVGLRLEGEAMEAPGAKLFREGKEVGHITSCVYSPRAASAIAMGYVRRGNEEPETMLTIAGPGGRKAVVASLPFHFDSTR